MAKTKTSRVEEEAPRTPDRPTKRHRVKAAPEKVAPAPERVPALRAPEPRAKAAPAAAPADAGPTIKMESKEEAKGPEVSWNNFPVIKKHFGLDDKDTERVLTSLIGPPPKWFAFRVKPSPVESKPASKEPTPAPENTEVVKTPEPVKEEVMETHAVKESAAPAKRRRLREADYEVCDNQLGDPTLYPDLHPECFTTDEGDTQLDPEHDAEDGEEEEPEDDEEIAVPATGGGNDDQDSPQGGSAAEPAEAETVRVEPPEQTEPVLVPAEKPDDPAVLAREALERTLKSTPTPSKGRQVVQAKRIDSSETPLKSLLSLSMF